jgi:hypothetical protein
MTQQIDSSFPTLFQQIFAAFCLLLADSCISLFFLVLNSKLAQLLITTDCLLPSPFAEGGVLSLRADEGGEVTHQNQTNFDSNVAIATFDHEAKTNFSNVRGFVHAFSIYRAIYPIPFG